MIIQNNKKGVRNTGELSEKLMEELECRTVFTIPVFGGIDVAESVVVTWIIMGFILIKGSELELIKLDTLQGNISISGTINSINYIESEKNDKSSGFIGKLFK